MRGFGLRRAVLLAGSAACIAVLGATSVHKGLAADKAPFYDETPQGDVANARADNANGVNADDGTVFSVRTFDEDSSLTTAPGWDDVTGVGSPTPKYLDEIALGW
jgi:hypothetical protein